MMMSLVAVSYYAAILRSVLCKSFLFLCSASGFYKRTKRTRDWPPDETIRFYRCLHTIGTDFSLMLTLFPNRSRRDMKLKFKKEERNNPALINKALLHPKLFDIDELRRDFKEEEEESERERAKLEETKKQQAILKKYAQYSLFMRL